MAIGTKGQGARPEQVSLAQFPVKMGKKTSTTRFFPPQVGQRVTIKRKQMQAVFIMEMPGEGLRQLCSGREVDIAIRQIHRRPGCPALAGEVVEFGLS